MEAGTTRRCAALYVQQMYYYVLSGEPEQVAKMLAREDMKEHC